MHQTVVSRGRQLLGSPVNNLGYIRWVANRLLDLLSFWPHYSLIAYSSGVSRECPVILRERINQLEAELAVSTTQHQFAAIWREVESIYVFVFGPSSFTLVGKVPEYVPFKPSQL